MFEKGTMVYYGTAGVCKVSDICSSPFDKNDDRMYYVLAPAGFDNGTIIYAPAEGGKVMLRPLMSAEEAEALVSSLPELPVLDVLNEKHRREEYKNAMRDGAPESIARLIKTVYLRKKNAPKTQKRMSDTDAEFDKIARKALFGELCHVFGASDADVESRVNTYLKACI